MSTTTTTTTTATTTTTTTTMPVPATTPKPASNLDMSDLPPLDVLLCRPIDENSWAGDLELYEKHVSLDCEAEVVIASAIKQVSKQTIWHDKEFKLPLSALYVYSNPDLRSRLCGYCNDFAHGGVGNIVIDSSGKVTQVFCGSCRFVIRSYAGDCTGGHEGCVKRRHVDPNGEVAPLCKVCHQAQTQRGKRGKRGGASHKQDNTDAKPSTQCLERAGKKTSRGKRGGVAAASRKYGNTDTKPPPKCLVCA